MSAEAAASAKLGREGHVIRLWRPPVAPGQRNALCLYRTESEPQLDGLPGTLPLSAWMRTTATPASGNPNDPS